MKTQKTINDLSQDLEFYDHDVALEFKNSDKEIAQALATLKRAIADAEHEAARPTATTLQKVSAVMHALAWGYANATSNLENALSSAGREYVAVSIRARTQAKLDAIRDAK